MSYILSDSRAVFVNKYIDFGLPWWRSGKESASIEGDLDSIPRWGRFPEGGNGNPLQYSHLENPVDRGSW